MSSSWFYSQVEKNDLNSSFLDSLKSYAEARLKQIYVIDSPLGDSKYTYEYENALVVLVPKSKILFVDFGEGGEDFDEFVEDFLEDIGSISDKFLYKQVLGRPKKWKSRIIEQFSLPLKEDSIEGFIDKRRLEDVEDQRKCELIISLLTGSINDIDRVGKEPPVTVLDAVKQKIQLFDGDQTRFIYQSIPKRSITIQGLSGTGKTELLLHKLKELYTSSDSSRIMLTCHNKILANNLKRRIPVFFDFMKVEQQILWDKRLWCVHGWGSSNSKDSGAYRYICDFYDIPFHTYSRSYDFDQACKDALSLVTSKIENYGPAFDFMLIDESQDFPESFFQLCDQVTEEKIYIAGDIFQSIFDDKIVSEVNPDFLLSKCYRTDPRTLMFAHGLGMGLFENRKLKWLEEAEWKACGYIVDDAEEEQSIVLKREPLRRFEDIGYGDAPSVEVVEYTDHSGLVDNIVDAIGQIKEEHPSVQPGDIGVIFIHPSRRSYQLADRLQLHIGRNFEWPVNKAYETKRYDHNALFISNQNNVKGLEFPFVICVAERISNGHHFRNALYMMLTRSFLKTFLVVSEAGNSEILPCIYRGIEEINRNGEMTVEIPGEDEVDRTSIEYHADNISLLEVVDLICAEEGFNAEDREMALKIIKTYQSNNVVDEYTSRDDIRGIILDNKKHW